MLQKQPRFEGGKDRKTTLPWDMDAVIKREEINGALSFAEGPASKKLCIAEVYREGHLLE